MKNNPWVFHLESQTILREIIQQLLFLEGITGYRSVEIEVVDLIDHLEKAPPDIVILGINKKDPSLHLFKSIEICKLLHDNFPETKIIAHSAYSDISHIKQLFNGGVSGFVNKSDGYDELRKAVNIVNDGGRYLSLEDSMKFTNADEFLAFKTDKLSPILRLFSNREIEVLSFIARGYRTQDIAHTLKISDKTVETHRKNLVNKSSVKNTAELMTYSFSNGLV